MKLRSYWKIIPYLLLAGYVTLVTFFFFNIIQRLNTVLSHPVHVLQYSREIEYRLQELRLLMPGLIANRDLSLDDILYVIDKQESEIDQAYDDLAALYMGPRGLLGQLREALDKCNQLRREVVQNALGRAGYTDTISIYHDTMDPALDTVADVLNKVALATQEVLDSQRQDSRTEMIVYILATLLTGLAIAIAFKAVSAKESRTTRELKTRDQLFNQLSQNVDEVLLIAHGPGDFKFVSSNSKRLIGIPATELLQNPALLYDFLPEPDAAWMRERLDKPAENSAERQRKILLDNGQSVFSLSIYPIEDNENARSIIALQDKTEEFKQQQALSDALENAHAASIAKSSFLSHMSHEIRTPMNAIIGMTTIALSRLGDITRVKDCLNKIGESSRHLLRLINDVLDMSKIENGKLAINQERFSLSDALTSLVGVVRPQAQERHLNFAIFQDNVDEYELIGDPLRLNQVLLNIFSNALKFTPPGGSITLRIQQTVKTDTNLRLTFTITDTGIGMSQEFLNRLYTPFEQASSNTAAKYGGTGLGMSITFNLVSLMGGTISVQSTEGIGTTFSVDLPFGHLDEAAQQSDQLPSLKVLIVDDDAGTCEHTKLLLEKMGVAARSCTSGAEAVQLVEEAHKAGAPFDICLVDWHMPGMNGGETAKKIRQVAGSEMTIIIISAYDWDPIAEEARAAGVSDFIPKPFFASTLHDALLKTYRKSQPQNAPEPKKTYDFSGKRILLVEDNDFNREIAQEYLSMVNATFEDAVNGKEAVERFTSSPAGYYDMILMDVQMPVMNGYEATREIRASNHPDASKVRILAMTANAFSEDVALSVGAGMNGHVAKPIDINELYQRMAANLYPETS